MARCKNKNIFGAARSSASSGVLPLLLLVPFIYLQHLFLPAVQAGQPRQGRDPSSGQHRGSSRAREGMEMVRLPPTSASAQPLRAGLAGWVTTRPDRRHARETQRKKRELAELAEHGGIPWGAIQSYVSNEDPGHYLRSLFRLLFSGKTQGPPVTEMRCDPRMGQRAEVRDLVEAAPAAPVFTRVEEAAIWWKLFFHPWRDHPPLAAVSTAFREATTVVERSPADRSYAALASFLMGELFPPLLHDADTLVFDALPYGAGSWVHHHHHVDAETRALVAAFVDALVSALERPGAKSYGPNGDLDFEVDRRGSSETLTLTYGPSATCSGTHTRTYDERRGPCTFFEARVNSPPGSRLVIISATDVDRTQGEALFRQINTRANHSEYTEQVSVSFDFCGKLPSEWCLLMEWGWVAHAHLGVTKKYSTNPGIDGLKYNLELRFSVKIGS
ncbi:unnamed protein product [Amoebophrya sp. A120]|nr:unnamed protein product [Amoebophrya sp. A120]|eukprot:GSA120T00000461001.1